MSDASSSSTEPRFVVWMRRTGGPEGPFSLRFQMAGGKGILRLSRPGVLVDPPARATGEEGRLSASQLRSARLLHVWGKGAFRQGYVLSRLDDESLARLPAEAWVELGVARDGSQAYMVVPATPRVDPNATRTELGAFSRNAVPLSRHELPGETRPAPFLRNKVEPASVVIPRTVETRQEGLDRSSPLPLQRVPAWGSPESTFDRGMVEGADHAEEDDYSLDDLPDTVEEESEESSLDGKKEDLLGTRDDAAEMDAFQVAESPFDNPFEVEVGDEGRGGRAPAPYSRTGRIEDAVVQVGEFRKPRLERVVAEKYPPSSERIPTEKPERIPTEKTVGTALAERAPLERVAVETAPVPEEKTASERGLSETAVLERTVLERRASERRVPDRAVSEKAASERAASERTALERAASERAAPGRSTPEKVSLERFPAENERAADTETIRELRAELAAEQAMVRALKKRIEELEAMLGDGEWESAEGA